MAGRPTKEPGEKMSVPLRIMLTASQDEAIRQAAQLAGKDVSAWARPLLLEAARDQIEKIAPPKRRRKREGEGE